MHKLLVGIQQFQRKVFPGWRRRFESLAECQQPPALFITCSDSRIVPHLVTQSAPGELFVLRNAGNLVPPYGSPLSGEAATIEYAVQVLKVEQIIVCGHSHCGAVSALLDPKSTDQLPAVREWLKHAERTKELLDEKSQPVDRRDDALTHAIKTNIAVQLDHLRSYPDVAQGLSAGTLTLQGWFYRFETAEITTLNEETGDFAPILAQQAPASMRA